MMNTSKLYGIINRVLFGVLAIGCLGNKCQLVSTPVAGYDITILQIIIMVKLVAFNFQFITIIWFLREQRGARMTNARQQIPSTETPELIEYRLRMQTEIRDIQVETMVISAWMAFAEYVAFKTASTTPEYRNELMIACILFSTGQEY